MIVMNFIIDKHTYTKYILLMFIIKCDSRNKKNFYLLWKIKKGEIDKKEDFVTKFYTKTN